MKEENLIFLISQPRSGSTLTQKLLGSHSEIYTRSEPWLMLHPSYSLKDSGFTADYDTKNEKKAFNSFINGLPYGKETYINELKKMYLNLYSNYLNNGETYFLDKTPRYYLIIDELTAIYPSAKYLILIRNPLAVLGSIINTWTKNNWLNLYRYKHDLFDAIQVIINIKKSRNSKFYICNYEDLLSNQVDFLKKICKYLNIGYEERMHQHHQLTEKWIFGDQENVYAQDGINVNTNENWKKNLHNEQYWQLMHDYLRWIGEENFMLLGYNYKDTEKYLNNHRKKEWGKMPIYSLNSLLNISNERRKLNQVNIDVKALKEKLKMKEKELEKLIREVNVK